MGLAKLRLFSAPHIVLVLLLLLILALPGFKGFAQLDKLFFQLAATLLPVAERTDDVHLIHLPDEVMSDPLQTDKLIKLIEHLSRSGASAIGLLSKVLPMQDRRLLADKSRQKNARGELSQLASSLSRYQVTSSLNHFSVVQSYQSQIQIEQEAAYRSAYLDYLPDIFLPYRETLHIDSADVIYPYDILPMDVQGTANVSSQLIWYDDDSPRVLPGFNLGLLARHLHSDRLVWQKSEGLDLQTQFIATGIQSQFYYLPTSSTEHSVNENSHSIERALDTPASMFKNKIVIMGNDYFQLVEIDRQLSSLLSADIYITPGWLYIMSQLLLLMLFIYLVIVPRFYQHSGYLLGVLLLLSVTALQYALLISKHLWLPLSGFYIYLLLGQIIVQLSIQQQYKINRIKQQAYNAFWKLGEYQYYQGDYDKALSSLIKCKTNDDVLALLYDIGLNYERRRQYENAANVYSEIQKRNKNYHDVKKRLHTLKNLSIAQGEAGMQAADTLVLQDSGLQLPVLGRYEIEKEIGRGAMGVVYLGKDPKINRQVAIKTLNYSLFNSQEIKAIKQRFFREAEAAGRLNHPNIVTVYDLGEEDDFSFIAMDFVPGVSLGEYARADNLLPVDEVLRIIVMVAETLNYAHSQNIVHRDIKPSNIMYNPDTGAIKITDFGIARITDSVRTRTGSFMGSPSYMSPEQMTAQHVDGQSDIYALGVSMYQLLTGSLPYVADSLGNLAYKITHEKHRPIRDVRAELPGFITRIINKSLQKDPQKRYLSGDEMAAAIQRHISRQVS